MFFSIFYNYSLVTLVNFYIELLRCGLHVIQALNGNKCNAYFVSGKIKELIFLLSIIGKENV